MALAADASASKPEAPHDVGPSLSIRRSMDPVCPHPPSLAKKALWRHDLRQEPDAVTPPVRICGGGRMQVRSLLRPTGRRLIHPAVQSISGGDPACAAALR